MLHNITYCLWRHPNCVLMRRLQDEAELQRLSADEAGNLNTFCCPLMYKIPFPLGKNEFPYRMVDESY